MLTTVLLIIILVGYCSRKHTVNYGTIGAYEEFAFGNYGWIVGGVWEETKRTVCIRSGTPRRNQPI